MNPLVSIRQFEFRYHLRQPIFYLFAILTLLQGYWGHYKVSSVSFSDSSIIDTYAILASYGLALAIATVLITSQSLTKDLEFQTKPYIYSLPISSRTLFAGRFLGSLVTALTLVILYPLGIVLGFIQQDTPLTRIPWAALLDGTLRLLVPTCLILVSFTFALTVFFQSIKGAYLILFLSVLYFLVVDAEIPITIESDIWQLVDPFGLNMVHESIANLPFPTTADSLLSFTDMLFINRLFWIGLSLGVVAQAESRFSFTTFGQQKPADTSSQSYHPQSNYVALPTIQPRFGRWVSLQTILAVARAEFIVLVRQPVVHISSAFLVISMLLNVSVFNQNPDFPELPLTYRIIAFQRPSSLFISLFLSVITVEVFDNERSTRFWPIYNALPQSNFTLLFAKIVAIIYLACLLTGVLFLSSIGLQLSSSFYEIDWQLYASVLLVDGLFHYCQLIILSGLVAVSINNRVGSHVINLLIFAALSVSHYGNGPEYVFSFLPDSATYSDLIGYGSQTMARHLLPIIWWSITGLFASLIPFIWNRSNNTSLLTRIAHIRQQIGWRYGLVPMAFLIGAGFGIWLLNQQSSAKTAPIHYRTQTAQVRSLSGKRIAIQVHYYHPYQVKKIIEATISSLKKGEELFGPYPYKSIQICETPKGGSSVQSKPGRIAFDETQGWIADYRQPKQLDYIDYRMSREVFDQWLVHRISPQHEPENSLIGQTLSGYLALQEVSRKYGHDRLQQRIEQRRHSYLASRNRIPPKTLGQTSSGDDPEREKGVMTLTSIEQVWGNTPLSLTISQFYHQAVRHPQLASADAFSNQLAHRLPDSLRYLTSYLTERLWFDFRLGRIAIQPNGLTVEIIPAKWRELTDRQRIPTPIPDYIPITILDRNGREIYRQLVQPDPDIRNILLPNLPNAKAVLIDPLGVWPERNKRDNYKIL